MAEDTSPTRELAKRVDELQRKAAAMVLANESPAEEIDAMAQTQLAKKQWNKRIPDDCKRQRLGDGSQGGA